MSTSTVKEESHENLSLGEFTVDDLIELWSSESFLSDTPSRAARRQTVLEEATLLKNSIQYTFLLY